MHSKGVRERACPQKALRKIGDCIAELRAVTTKRLIESRESRALGRCAQERGKLAARKSPKIRAGQISPDRGRSAISGSANSLLGIDCGFVTCGWGNCDRGDFPNLFVLSDTSRVPT
jgi:hypothetical protein